MKILNFSFKREAIWMLVLNLLPVMIGVLLFVLFDMLQLVD